MKSLSWNNFSTECRKRSRTVLILLAYALGLVNKTRTALPTDEIFNLVTPVFQRLKPATFTLFNLGSDWLLTMFTLALI